jgi:hypothetical protein
MEPVPSYLAEWIDQLDWPDPNRDGSTTLTHDQLGKFNAILTALTNYIETQLIVCRKID